MGEEIDREKLVLETLKGLSKPIGEDEYHMIHKGLDATGRGLGFSYNLNYWEHFDERLKSKFGAVPISPGLHKIVEELVEKGLVKRDPENPIMIEYSGGDNGLP